MTETQRRTENLQRAYVVYRALAAACEMLFQPTTTESGMIVRLCQTLIQDTDFCAVWLAHPGTDGVFLSLGRAVQKPEDEQWLDGLHLTAQDHDSTIARVWRTQTPVIHEDLISGRDCEADARLVGRLGGASVLAVPVERAGEPWAVLVFIARHPFAFDEATQSACEQVAVLLRYALEEVDRKRVQGAQQDSESRRARTDPLTGLPNRLALDEHLPGALARARRRQKTVAVGILDLDDFKPVNDRFGHAAGDVLLRRFVDMLRARLRETDFLARIGGDEFVIVSEDLDPDQVMDPLGRALERVHTAVEAPFDLGHGRSAQVGMTMGIALYPQEAEEADALLHLADTAMYACKVDKMDRTRWWHAGAKGFDLGAESARESVLEPFGLAASLELQLLDARVLDAAATTFATAFYDELAQEPELASVLDCLSPDEFDHLKQKQAAHLLFLLQPEMTRHTLEENARKLGQIHALVGISGASLERTFTLYEDLLRKELDNTPLTARVRYRILRVATARLRLDIQAQLTAMDQIIGAYFSRLHAPTPTHARWIDTLGDLLDDLVALPGIRHAAVLRPDERGVLHMVAGAGADFDRVMGTIEREELYPNLNPSPGVERGPLAMAWFTHDVQVVDAYLLDPRLRPWHALARDVGWRSAATLPLQDRDQVDSILMLFGAYPHQFTSNWARSWLDLLQSRLSATFMSSLRDTQLPRPDQIRLYRERLYDQGLCMWLQPIVDLKTGAVPAVEALARLRLADGRVLTPAQFLPAFGTQDLHALFRLGLEQALEFVQSWHRAGLAVEIAVNLSASTLLHPDCPSWVEEALRKSQVPAPSLTLEVLESEELDELRADAAIGALHALGVRLTLDDLGSGYSSLKRLASLPIDTVKIDQTLIRGLLHDPIKTTRLLASLVHMGQQFARRTVIEGLEDPGFLEAARQLGAGLGQGYALAHPMPAEAFLPWMQSRSVPEAAGEGLHTWPGMLAYYWVVEGDPLHRYQHRPLETCPISLFLRAQGIREPEVQKWHEIVHSDAGHEARDTAFDALLSWFGGRVEAVVSG